VYIIIVHVVVNITANDKNETKMAKRKYGSIYERITYPRGEKRYTSRVTRRTYWFYACSSHPKFDQSVRVKLARVLGPFSNFASGAEKTGDTFRRIVFDVDDDIGSTTARHAIRAWNVYHIRR